MAFIVRRSVVRASLRCDLGRPKSPRVARGPIATSTREGLDGAMKDKANLLDRAGPWFLVIGAVAFGLFWEAALFSDADIPVAIALGVHGISIVTIAMGLIHLQRSASTDRSAIGWVGVALSIAGTAASFVLLAVGLILIVISLLRAREWRDVSSLLVAGSIALLISYLLGARVGTEDAADPSLVAAIFFGGAILLISLGLLLIGVRQLAGLSTNDGELSPSLS